MDIYFNILPEELNKLILFNINTFDDLVNLKDIFQDIFKSDTFWKEKILYNLFQLDIPFFFPNIHEYKNISMLILYYCKLYKSYNIKYNQVIKYCKQDKIVFQLNFYSKVFIMKKIDGDINNKLIDGLYNNIINRLGIYIKDNKVILSDENYMDLHEININKGEIFFLVLNLLVQDSICPPEPFYNINDW